MENPDRVAGPGVQRPGPFRFIPQLEGLSLDSIPSGRIPLKIPPIHRMGSNEIPYQPLSSVKQAMSRAVAQANRYPDPSARALTEAIARHHDVPLDQVAVGVGSVGVLTQLVMATCNAQAQAIWAWPSFEAYPTIVQVSGARAAAVPLLPDGRHDLEAMAAAVTGRTALILLCTPNNPTGTCISTVALRRFLNRVPGDVLVVVDEAYAEFVRDPNAADGLELRREFPNLVVVRTFSKAYGLAGLRVGYAIADPDVTAALRKTAVPFSVSDLAQAAAVASLQAQDELRTRVDSLVAERERVIRTLRGHGWAISDSQGNFVWLALEQDAGDFAAECARAGLEVRPLPGLGVRCTIAQPAANDRLLEVCAEFRRRPPLRLRSRTTKGDSVMTNPPLPALRNLSVDHVTIYVDDLDLAEREYRERYRLNRYAVRGDPAHPEAIALGRDGIRLVLRAGGHGDPVVEAYLARHGSGVADIAFTVSDVAAAFEHAVGQAAAPAGEPHQDDGVRTASITAFGDVTHTFLQRAPETNPDQLPGFTLLEDAPVVPDELGLQGIDHFAVCLEAGQLAATAEFYESALGFRTVFTERIQVGTQAMDSRAVSSDGNGVTLTLIEPDPTLDAGQIDDFLKNHDGPGVQHIALLVDDILVAIRQLRAVGAEFLNTPDAYYALLSGRMTPQRHSVPDLQAVQALMDQDHDGQLFQIFARSTHPRGTLFFEIIERLGAQTFGSGNIAALYESLELERTQGKP